MMTDWIDGDGDALQIRPTSGSTLDWSTQQNAQWHTTAQLKHH